MVELGGGSVGFQIGAEATDVVMLVMNRQGTETDAAISPKGV